MTRYTVAKATRRALDQRLQHVDVAAMAPPRGGSWIHAVRESLMMSAAELGSRLGISRQAVSSLQASEVAGTVRLESLQRAAEAMDCHLVYALVPNTTLQGTVETQAARIVDTWASQTVHTMALENQTLNLSAAAKATARADLIEDLIRSGRIWPAR